MTTTRLTHSAACTPVVRGTKAQLLAALAMCAARKGITERRRAEQARLELRGKAA